MEALQSVLVSWDGKLTKPLEDAFAAYRSDPGFLNSLIGLSENESCERASTWLLKHHFDTKGERLSIDQSRKHLAILPHIRHWEAKLHVLQYLEQLELPVEAETTLNDFLTEALASENKLVRAWAYYGLATLACRFPSRKMSALELLTSAQERETAGSIKVRIRKALKKLGG
ncbi:hypothetical protein ABLO27_24040 [Roseibium sp. SCPC15]|uniref:hypothetical protein n=1 Tax=Roseibium sp. SCP15 TaxID=3141376 RepID=UPI00333CD6EE